MKLSTVFLTITVVAGLIASTFASDVELTATKTKLDEQKDASISRTKVTQELAYKVTVANKTFKNLSDLTIKYMIVFEEAADIGAGDDSANKKTKTGSLALNTLDAHKSTTLVTKPITISEEKMKAGWVAGGAKAGSSRESSDRVRGIWFRVYNAEGTVLGEYCNPSTLSRNTDWKE